MSRISLQQGRYGGKDERYTDYMKFENLNISSEILRGLEEMGFSEATPIQEQSIPEVLQGKDLIGQAQTGTGKTCAYGIPAVQMTDPHATAPQVLTLCPTRELASQVADEFRRLTKYMQGIRILAIYGGQSIENQIAALKKKPQIIIGTPGRVMDHMRRRTLRFDHLKMLILDEADEMLNMGFREDIDTILSEVPEEKQMLLFSATMAPEIMKLTETYQKDPVYIQIARKELTTDLTEQRYIEVREPSKIELLCRLIDVNGITLGLVFCNTKRRADQVTSRLQDRGYAADALHGDMQQHERERVMNKFRKGITQILVATDVAARGIDVSGVQAVFNYDIPEDPEQYVHRIGRTGRAGNTGKAYSFVFGRDMYKLREIMKYTGSSIGRMRPPAISEVESVQIGNAAEKAAELVRRGAGSKYLEVIRQIAEKLKSAEQAAESGSGAEISGSETEEILSDGVFSETAISAENREEHTAEASSKTAADAPGYPELAAALFSLAFSELEGKSYQHADFDEEEFSYDKMNMTRLFINAGRTDGLRESDIVKAVASGTSLSGRMIGTIELHTNFSFVDVPESHADEVISSMRDYQLKGRGISFERASKKRRGGSSGKKKGGRRTDSGGRDRGDRERARTKRQNRESSGYFMENNDSDKGRQRGNGDAYRRRRNSKFSGKGRRRK